MNDPLLHYRMARELRDGLYLLVGEVAQVLYSEEGLDLSVVATGLTLREGLDISTDEVTRVMGVIHGR